MSEKSPASLLMRWWLAAMASVAVFIGAKKRALELYAEIVALDPANLDARATLGNLHAERGDCAAAVAEFEQLVRAHPDHADSWFNLGFLYEQEERLDDAEGCFRRACQLNPQHDRAWYGLGLALIRCGRLGEAVDALKANIKLQPFSPYGYYQLAMTQHHLGSSGEAWRVYEQLKGFEPRYAATLKRDIESTPSRARAQGAPAGDGGSDSPTTKEALGASI
jgi:tetratricopeptide (TPR) repeat protein